VASPKLLDRQAELARLERAWKEACAGRPQLAVLWGRRRVGKTFLLSHFARGRRALFFGATRQAEGVELRRLLEALHRDLGGAAADLTGGGFRDWEAALRFLAATAREEPLCVVLDEVPYLARSTPGFASILQSVWDHIGQGTRLMLVLTGSAVGMVESMLQAGGALRGRPTLALRLDPVDPWAARTFLPGLAPGACLEAYAACGGYPLHLLAWDGARSTAENLLVLAATAGGVLLEDASGILQEELPETGGYSRILAAVGRGRTRYSEIAGETGQRVEHPLEVLVRTGFLARSVPVGAPRAAKPSYALADTYLAFWFRVLYSDLPLIEGGQGRAVLKRAQARWQDHLGWVFEEVARAHARRLVESGGLPDDLVVGRWWAQQGAPCEVDVLGLRGTRSWLLGEARWGRDPLGRRDLEELRAKLPRVPQAADEPVFALWGRAGVTEEVRRAGALGFGIGEILA